MDKNFTFEQALSEPDEYFHLPEDILKNNNYSKEQKLKLLQQWKNDIIELLTAEEENMPQKNVNGTDFSDIIGKINVAIENLG